MYLLLIEWMEGGHSDVQQRQNSLERGLGGKPHVELEQVHLSQAHRNHLQPQHRVLLLTSSF